MAVIEFEHVSKAYRLGAGRISLREAITQMPRKLFGRNGDHTDDLLFWALNDVSFRVEPGEVLGIIGPNGAGKSTILKLLSKVTFPTSGYIRTRGRMAALIELGAGFHPDLTGRENIYLNGAILGLKRQEIEDQFSTIVEFAGLERFIDTPIKRYSSGMYVRLAFAVAAHVRAELLLVDEVLSVGDMTFQQKCLAKMNELRDNGATIVFVSHNLAAVQTFCERALLLHSGRVAVTGDVLDVIRTYEQLEEETRKSELMQAETQREGVVLALEDGNGAAAGARMTEVELLNVAGQPAHDFQPTDGLIVRCHYVIPHQIKQPVYMLRVRRRADGFVCFTTYTDDPTRPSLQGQGVFKARIDELLLHPGHYMLETRIHSDLFWDEAEAVTGLPEPFSITGELPDDEDGIFEPNVEWSFESVEPQPELNEGIERMEV
jgi:ABC-type polysaccharide/polyol phosphate transport system ATPase subunit